MDDKVLEELEFHQETASSDANSPLHLIREKEMEITGRVLTAKREAEDIVAAARKKAVETVNAAEEQSEKDVAEHQQKVLGDVESEIEQIKESTDGEIVALKAHVETKTDDAAKRVVELITNA